MPDPETTGGENPGGEERTPPPEAFTLAKEKFEEYVRDHHRFTIENLKGESETPNLIVVTRNAETLEDELNFCLLACPFNEAEEKQKLMHAMGKKFFEEKKVVLAIILSSECWMAKRNVESDWQDVMPRDDPMRQEGIMIAGAGLDPTQRMIIMTPIKRDEKNHMVVDGKPDEMADGKGRFFLLEHFWRGYFHKLIEKQKKEQGK